MALDGFFIKHLISEIKPKITGSRLDKIGQIDDAKWLLSFYRQGTENLVIDLTHQNRLFLVSLTKPHTKPTIDQFTQNFKRFLEGAILEDISQYLTDRVIIFTFKYNDYIFGQKYRKLIIELMGKHANLFIVEDDVILDCFKKMFFETGRQSIPKATFEFFPTTKGELTKNHKVFDVDDLLNFNGVSKKLAQFLTHHQKNVFDIEINPTKNLDNQDFYWFNIFNTSNIKTYTTLSEIQEIDLSNKISKPEKPIIFIENTIHKLMKKLAIIEKQAIDNLSLLDHKIDGDYIYQSGLNLKSYHSSITVFDRTIVLDVTKTLNENAQNFYQTYQKAKRREEHLKNQKIDTLEQLDAFKSFKVFYELASKEDMHDLESDLAQYGYLKDSKAIIRKKQNKPNIITLKFNETTIYIGKNDLQNNFVTHELGHKNDYFFHVKDAPGGHILVKTEFLDEALLRTSAMLAAYFSSLRYSSSIPVDYTQIRNIKKISGQHGSKVIMKNYKTIYIDIDEDKIRQLLHKN